MNEKDVDQAAEPRSPKKKSSSKVSTDEPGKSTTNGEKKKKTPKTPKTDEVTNNHDDTQTTSAGDQETAPVKPKKKKAPKIEVNNENAEPISEDQPVKKKKAKAPKLPPPAADDEFQIIDTPAIDELDSFVEPKPKQKKAKKSKPKLAGSFEQLEVTNLDDTYSANQELDVNTNEYNGDYSADMADYSADNQVAAENGASDYERGIVDTYSNLQARVDFSQYVGADQWCIIHLPKTARTEPKSRLRKMLPGGSKDDKPATKSSTGKPGAPKESMLKRLRTSVNSLVRDENNLIFGERSNYEMGDEEDDPDGVDTDDLHRYAQKLRELEDQDREINPEFLVLRDGKTVYGVHESDLDGKVKLSTRKPIYDRYADQTPDDQEEKKKLLTRLKHPFARKKDKDGKDSKSANVTPDPRADRKSTRKSLTDEVAITSANDPMMI